VPKYDAFGREIGDDPLEALRESAPAPPAPEVRPAEPWPDPEPRPAPEAVAEPDEPAAPPPRIQFVRPRRRRGGMARLVLTLAILGAVGLAVVNVGTRVEGGIDDIVDSLPKTVDPEPPATGVTGDSLVRRANFEAAIATLSRARLGRPLSMRVAPDRIDATLLAAGGRLHQVQITPGGALRELASSAGPQARTVAYAAIDSAAPERLVRAGATRKFPARSIDYLVLSAGPPASWGAYYKGGRIVLGDAHGRKQRVL
jgi:hypothetical protein